MRKVEITTRPMEYADGASKEDGEEELTFGGSAGCSDERTYSRLRGAATPINRLRGVEEPPVTLHCVNENGLLSTDVTLLDDDILASRVECLTMDEGVTFLGLDQSNSNNYDPLSMKKSKNYVVRDPSKMGLQSGAPNYQDRSEFRDGDHNSRNNINRSGTKSRVPRRGERGIESRSSNNDERRKEVYRSNVDGVDRVIENRCDNDRSKEARRRSNMDSLNEVYKDRARQARCCQDKEHQQHQNHHHNHHHNNNNRLDGELTSTTPPPTTGSSGTTPAKASSNSTNWSSRASSNAASDAEPNQIETRIITKIGGKRFKRFNYNWNNKVAGEPTLRRDKNANAGNDGGDGGNHDGGGGGEGADGGGGAQNNVAENKNNEDTKGQSQLCCCLRSDDDAQRREARDKQKLEISGDVDIPSQDGIPDFQLKAAPSHSLRHAFAREYKVFWSKLTKRFGGGGGGGRGDELIAPDGTYNVLNGTCPTDQDLIQARHLYETIPVLKESEIRIAKKEGERLILGKGNNGAVLIAFYSGSRREIPEGVALKIFFRSSIVSVRKEALLSALAAQTGSAPKVYGIVYMKRIDAHALICEFIPKRKNSHGSIEAWTLRTLIKDEKDNPAYPAAELFRLSLRMADGLQAIHDQHVVLSDIKTDNILLQLNEKGSIIPFYIDYGLSGFCKGKELNVRSHVGGKVRLKMEAENFMDKFPHYPPECARGECTSMAGDVFGLGRLYMRMFRGIKAIKRHPASRQFFQAFHACMRDNPKERLRLSVLRQKLSEIVSMVENEARHYRVNPAVPK